MSTQHTWAEVAHYYSKSEIMVRVDHEQGLDGGAFTRVSPKGEDLSVYVDGRRGDGWLVKPILRDFRDITEAEARKMYAIRMGFPYEYKTSKYDTAKDSIKDNDGMFTPSETHFLLQRGFDLFGLIESGQAIRKEAYSA